MFLVFKEWALAAARANSHEFSDIQRMDRNFVNKAANKTRVFLCFAFHVVIQFKEVKIIFSWCLYN